LEQVARVARMMVEQLGFSDRIGQVSVGGGDGQTFLGQEVGRTVAHSNHTAAVVEEETRRIVLRAYRRSKDLLQHNMGLLRQVTDRLLEARTTTAQQAVEEGGSRQACRPRPPPGRAPPRTTQQHLCAAPSSVFCSC
jgi:cell division protease FtsH